MNTPDPYTASWCFSFTSPAHHSFLTVLQTGRAIKFAVDHVFASSQRVNQVKNRIAVVVTDGKSQDDVVNVTLLSSRMWKRKRMTGAAPLLKPQQGNTICHEISKLLSTRLRQLLALCVVFLSLSFFVCVCLNKNPLNYGRLNFTTDCLFL